MAEKIVMRPVHADQAADLEVREVLKDLAGKPHLFTRVKLAGPRFAQRAPEPFVRVGGVQSRFAEIADDEQSVRGYFDRPMPDRGPVCFGYGDEVLLCTQRDVEVRPPLRLDRARIPKATVIPRELEGPR